MPEPNADGRHGPGLNPQALRPDVLARILSTSGGRHVDVATLEADIEAGAPTNADGTINLVHYAAWLVGEMGRGN